MKVGHGIIAQAYDDIILIISSLSMPMGVDYIVIGFDTEVQPLITHNAVDLYALLAQMT